MEILTHSPSETQKLGEKIAVDLSFGKLSSRKAIVLALFGNLGSGKTTFVQGLARGLGIKKRILSPTFVMIRQYPITNYKLLITNFFHIDLYRVENEKDVQGLGLSEIWSNPENIVVIEWADRIKEILPKKRMDIFFEYLDENKRRIKLLS